ncbi:4Fe-4S binding protein [Ancylomarina sp. 16SWW S1-10-2]|uniref:FMN-binding protein n=1 Tax=Ancylomarina sp. 16SWW S1-10-2 TaxID=2499681 RepID=UPI0012AD3506|nr:4Fe-4S binding protein [Ancylomarina sp. 16SWW S1-10-2]MRT93801.1 4Fe-4S binding protein [Ancylomarina sp. 16SWW S1-10-2]
MKVKSLNNILKSITNLVIIVLLLLSVAAWRGQLFGVGLKGDTDKNFTIDLKATDCQSILPNVSAVEKDNDQQFTLSDASNNLVGYAYAYRGELGYGGRVPVITFVDVDNVICGIILGENYESDEYLADAVKKGILTQWNGVARNQVMNTAVDAIAGATISSQAIIAGVQNSASEQLLSIPFKFWTVENVVSLALLMVLVFACFYPKKLMKYRTILQILTVVVFGFWLGRLISFVQFINWLSGGFNWQIQFVMLIVIVLSIIIPIIFGKAFYCSWVCPFGAAQELCGKACSKKLQITSKSARFLQLLRERLFIVLLLFLWTGYSFDLTLIEPFSAFSLTKLSYWSIGFASIFLIISIFIPKVWCRFFCPTGFILDWIRK